MVRTHAGNLWLIEMKKVNLHLFFVTDEIEYY